jgi:hypothetical protein
MAGQDTPLSALDPLVVQQDYCRVNDGRATELELRGAVAAEEWLLAITAEDARKDDQSEPVHQS